MVASRADADDESCPLAQPASNSACARSPRVPFVRGSTTSVVPLVSSVAPFDGRSEVDDFDRGQARSPYSLSSWAGEQCMACLLYTSDAADDLLCVDLGGRRIIKKKKKK